MLLLKNIKTDYQIREHLEVVSNYLFRGSPPLKENSVPLSKTKKVTKRKDLLPHPPQKPPQKFGIKLLILIALFNALYLM